MPMVRHFLLKVNAPEAARKLIGRLVSGDEADAPQIRTAKDWHVGVEPGPGDDTASAPCCKPCDCVNVSIPWLGLLALEVKDRIPSPSRSSRSRHSLPVPPRARNLSATPELMLRRIGLRFRERPRSCSRTLHAISPGGDDNGLEQTVS